MKTAKLFSIFVILALGFGQNSVLPASLVQANTVQKPSTEQTKLTTSPGNFDWHIEPIQTFTELAWISEHSLRIDSQGIPHIAYIQGGILYYAWRNGNGWQEQTVSTATLIQPDLSPPPSLVLGAGDIPYISFHDTGGLKVAIWNGSAWDIQTVDAVGTGPSSIALDRLGNPHISYDSTAGLKYASKTGTGWVIQPVDSQGRKGSLAIDSSGNAYIGYFASGVKVNSAHWNGSNWEIHTVYDITGQQETHLGDLSLALEPSDQPRMSYTIRGGTVLSNYMLYYAVWTGSGWSSEPVTGYGGIGGSGETALAINKAGQPFIVFADPFNLRIATLSGDQWDLQAIGGEKDASLSSLTFGPQDRARIAFLQQTSSTYSLNYAEQLAPPVLEKKVAPQTGVHPSEPVTYTLNVSAPWRTLLITDTLPTQVEYVTGTLSTSIDPSAVYSPTIKAILWQGTLTDTLQTIQFQVLVDSSGDPAATPLVTNTAQLSDPEHGRSASAFAILNGWRAYYPMIVQNYP